MAAWRTVCTTVSGINARNAASLMDQRHDKRSAERQTVKRAMSAGAIGALFALAAFVVAIVAGLYSHNSASTILVRSLLVMVGCYPVGLVIGLVSQWVIDAHVKQFVESNPVPDIDDAVAAVDGADAEMEDSEEVLVV